MGSFRELQSDEPARADATINVDLNTEQPLIIPTIVEIDPAESFEGRRTGENQRYVSIQML